jgi:uncharacterized metal-binding protein
VLYACAGCSEYGYAAPRVARALDERGLAEAHWLGDAPERVSERYPLLALDGCPKRCAREWVHAQGAAVQCALLLSPHERDDLQAAAERIARLLSP